MPPIGKASGVVMQIMSALLVVAVSSAMTANVGAAASDSQSAVWAAIRPPGQAMPLLGFAADPSAEAASESHSAALSDVAVASLWSVGGEQHRHHSLPYRSWWRHQMPVSLRPLGARSSHWYTPHNPSSPRA